MTKPNDDLTTAPVRAGTGHGIAYGAITVVNAIATSRGAAIGIDLATTATVTIEGPLERGAPLSLDLEATIASDPDEDHRLVRAVIETVLERCGIGGPVAAQVRTDSTIPVSRGLKSSSAAANALTIATLAALGIPQGREDGALIDDESVIKLGVDAALRAGVTITGAYDDATASYLGGLVVTDNADRRIVHHAELEPHDVLLVVPQQKVRTFDTSTSPTYPLRPFVDEAWQEAQADDWRRAMLRNSLAYGAAYGLDNRLVLSMLDTGAIAAGISGTGPATAVVIRPHDADCFTGILATLAPDAEVLVASTDRPVAGPVDAAPTLTAPERVLSPMGGSA